MGQKNVVKTSAQKIGPKSEIDDFGAQKWFRFLVQKFGPNLSILKIGDHAWRRVLVIEWIEGKGPCRRSYFGQKTIFILLVNW